MIEKAGIYQIKNIINHKIYIGSAANFRKRFNHHKYQLQNNKHYNSYLQNSWNKYGSNGFIFKILEIVKNKDNLIQREQYWLDKLNPEYNIRKIAHSNIGVKYPPISEETRLKLSKASKGRKHTEETKKKMSKKIKEVLADPEIKKKKSIRMSGENNHFYVKHLTEEHKQ